MDRYLAIYKEVTAEFFQDLKRRLEIKLHSVGDPFSAAALTNDFVATELAELRAQMLDLDLRISQIVSDPRKSALLSAASTIGMPRVYARSQSISMGDPIATYGFYMPEQSNNGSFRWSGPITTCGFIAHIDRSDTISVNVPIMSCMTPDIRVIAVHVDGEPRKFTFDNNLSLHYLLPALSQGDDPLFTPTLCSFTVNKVVRVSEVDPKSTDTRMLGIAVRTIDLTPANSGIS